MLNTSQESLFSTIGITEIEAIWLLSAIKGNIFESDIEASVNTVNGIGIMRAELLRNSRNVILIIF